MQDDHVVHVVHDNTIVDKIANDVNIGLLGGGCLDPGAAEADGIRFGGFVGLDL